MKKIGINPKEIKSHSNRKGEKKNKGCLQRSSQKLATGLGA